MATPAPNWSAYLASKAAFDTWLRSAAAELRRDRVAVSTVYCGLVRTRMSAPTAHYRRMPAMSATEAASVVCRAVAYQRPWWPWWARFGAVLTAALPRFVEWQLATGLCLVSTVETRPALASTGLWRPDRAVRLRLEQVARR